MTDSPKQVAVLGSTGSIGTSTLEVIAHHAGRLAAIALSAHSRLAMAAEQAQTHRPKWLVAADSEAAATFDRRLLPGETELLIGPEGLCQVATAPETDVVLAAIVGAAGLSSSLAAVQAGKTVALANKETLVAAGPLFMREAAQSGARVLPVDSEHSAVFQALSAGQRSEVNRIILTASGGPFRRHTQAQLENVTVDEALAHPTWDMGPKITIDSATMMNKALEIIEARWLFDLPPEKIDVVVHPQSVIHSLVEFVDGSVIAQMSPPDMKLPIQFALSWPDRWASPAEKLDLTAALRLDFEPPDEERFPALRLGREVAGAGGTAGVVVNAANEAAVAEFLAGRLSFTEIVPACRSILEQHTFDPNPSLSDILRLDAWARKELTQWVLS